MATGETYEQFVEKFIPKRTTDDCYTPEAVYEALKAWAVKNLHLEGREIVRPFWPGGDYKSFAYPENCVVIDNPPFSRYSEIVRFYIAQGIDFLLFAPALTQLVNDADVCYIATNNDITYTNGAVVHTGFTTNLMPGIRMCSVPDLRDSVQKAADDFRKYNSKEVGKSKRRMRKIKKYAWPDHLTSSARIGKIAKRGVSISIPSAECRYIKEAGGVDLFGYGLLLTELAATELAAAARSAAAQAAAEEIIPIEIEPYKPDEEWHL